MSDRSERLCLSADEALVLLAFFRRELWMLGFEHPAEAYALLGLLRELLPPTLPVADLATADARVAEARERLWARHR